MSGYEPLRDQLEELKVPAGEARRLIWIAIDRLGAALTATGSYEIFMVGPELRASSALVARHLQHDRWEPKPGGEAFEATRVLLGPAAHFAAVAALIATELARFDLSTFEALQQAFTDVEPIIEMAIRRSTLSDETLLGLLAELHVLKAALVSSSQTDRVKILLGWRGWTKGRDFVFGFEGIEVKATTGAQSRHQFSGIHQLETQLPPKGDEERLWLLSVGLSEIENGGHSLPELVDELLMLLENGSGTRTPSQQQLLSMIAAYGEVGGGGYDHDNARHWPVYQRRFSIAFCRLYDVADPQMRLLSRELIEQTFAVAESVTFSLLLPDKISASNPVILWQRELARIAKGN